MPYSGDLIRSGFLAWGVGVSLGVGCGSVAVDVLSGSFVGEGVTVGGDDEGLGSVVIVGTSVGVAVFASGVNVGLAVLLAAATIVDARGAAGGSVLQPITEASARARIGRMSVSGDRASMLSWSSRRHRAGFETRLRCQSFP